MDLEEFNIDVSLSDDEIIETEEDTVIPEISQYTKLKITSPIMTTNEKAAVIINRIKQLDKNYKSTFSQEELKEKNVHSSYDIAVLEFETNNLPPYKIKRNLPNGLYELWSHDDFKYFPQ